MNTNKILIAFVLVVVSILFYTSCSKDEETITPPPNQTTNNNDINITFDTGAGVTFDGYTYSSIVLGNGQEWLAENLRTTIYCNGDPIPNVTDGTQWSNLTTGAWAHTNNDSQYENPYGKIYNWYAAADVRNICPCGWRLPTDSDWQFLFEYLDPAGSPIFGSINIAGGKMKSTGTQYWLSPNTDATNESGFSGLPGGIRLNYGAFSNNLESGSWWSAREYNNNTSYYWYLRFNNGSANISNNSKNMGYSVRCIKN